MEIIASHKLEVIRIVCGERRAGEKSKVTLYWTDSWLRLAATEQSNRRENIGVHLIFRLNKQNRPPCERPATARDGNRFTFRRREHTARYEWHPASNRNEPFRLAKFISDASAGSRLKWFGRREDRSTRAQQAPVCVVRTFNKTRL